jgi:hypothetical protein
VHWLQQTFYFLDRKPVGNDGNAESLLCVAAACERVSAMTQDASFINPGSRTLRTHSATVYWLHKRHQLQLPNHRPKCVALDKGTTSGKAVEVWRKHPNRRMHGRRALVGTWAPNCAAAGKLREKGSCAASRGKLHRRRPSSPETQSRLASAGGPSLDIPPKFKSADQFTPLQQLAPKQSSDTLTTGGELGWFALGWRTSRRS